MSDHIIITGTEVLSDHYYILKKITYQTGKPEAYPQVREVYDRGNGVAILLYDPLAKNVVLTRQFRLPAFLNGSATGMLIEACAGVIDGDEPEDAIRRETEEETGFKITDMAKAFQAYMSPGAVTEILHFFTAKYDASMKISDGGGLAEEGEDIEVLELPFKKALDMIQSGEICDAKTIMLLQHARLSGLL
jgi:nudix-type nucleoside diphosphatase (YffH/AdpP family)